MEPLTSKKNKRKEKVRKASITGTGTKMWMTSFFSNKNIKVKSNNHQTYRNI